MSAQHIMARAAAAAMLGARRSRAWSPLSDPDTVPWWSAADSPRIESGGFIDQWDDLGPNGYDATSTLTLRPSYDATKLGGQYPAIVFDGVNDKMATPALAALAGATGISVFLVLKDNSAAARYLLEYGANGGVSLAGSFALLTNIGNANSLSFYVCGNVGSNFWRSNTGTEDLVTHKVITCRADFTAAGASEVLPIRVNGVPLAGAQTGTSNNTATFSSQVLAIGAQVSGASPQAVDLGDLIIVKRCVSDDDAALFEAYLA